MASRGWIAILIGAMVAGSDAPAAEAPARPNVVFILADDLGWTDIAPYGSTFHETPNLQRLANRSVRFTNYYTASPLCSPTRSSILTGLHPARTGITAPQCHVPQVQLEKRLVTGNGNQRILLADSVTRLKGEYVTLAESLKSAGYSTAHFGKWHLGHGAGYEPKDQGFDVDIPHTPNAAGPGGGYFAPWKFVRDPAMQGAPGEHIDEWMARRAGDFIRDHKQKPFYINFWMYSVHSPWNAQGELIEQYRKTANPQAGQRNPLYAAMVRKMDSAVGILLDALEAEGVADRTIVVFTSDNGGWAYPPRQTDPPGYESIPATSNAPLRSGKASNFEGGTRVPCLVSWPGRTRMGASDALFSSVDWFATLHEMTGTPTASKTDGISEVPAILGQPSGRDTVFVHFPHGSAAQEREIPGFFPGSWVRKQDWKLIRFYARNPDGSDALELYNLKDDVGETKNLAREQPERTAELSAILDRFLKETEAVVPKLNSSYTPGSEPPPAKSSPRPIAGWTPSQDAILEMKDGELLIQSRGGDPFITARDLPEAKGPYTLELNMLSRSRGSGQVFWSTAKAKPFHRDRSVTFAPTHDGGWQTYRVHLSVEESLLGLRIDPSTAPGEIRINRVELKDRDEKTVKLWLFDSKPAK